MNILLDTNIIIPLEDTNVLLDSSFAEMRKLCGEQRHCLYIHPLQYEDIRRDKNSRRREIVLSRLDQYSHITNPPIISETELETLKLSQTSENDKVDNNILFALYRGAVHVLVTNDNGIHKKAIQLGIQDKVYRLKQFLVFLSHFNKTIISNGYTGVKERFLYEIDKKQSFFDSLRKSYRDFDNWFQRSAEMQRKCWCIEDNDSNIVAICIFKEEENAQIIEKGEIVPGRILKLCTFKVAPSARGKKLGERLLFIAFDYCRNNNYDWIYLHTFGDEQETLVGLCLDYGFKFFGKYIKNDKEDVYIKPMKMTQCESDENDSLFRYYPYFKDNSSIQKFIIPIRPKYHEDLFPDFSIMKGSLFEQDQSLCNCQSNTIKKAYLCHSKTKRIKPGDIVLFYRSGDRKSIQCMGIVESVCYSDDINYVFPLIAKRTVYGYTEIQDILKEPTLVILFRYIPLSKEISKQTLIQADVRGNIQSIRKIKDCQYRRIINEQ